MSQPRPGTLDSGTVLLFLHIPKCGGTTFGSWLYEAAGKSSPVAIDKWYNHGVLYHPAGFADEGLAKDDDVIKNALADPNLRAVTGHFDFGFHRQLRQEFGYATILRDPLARVRSLFNFQKFNQDKWGSLSEATIDRESSIIDFVQQPPYPEIDNGMVRRLSGIGREREIGKCDEAMLDSAVNNLRKHFRVIGLVEYYDESLVMIGDAFGLGELPLYYPQNVLAKRTGDADLDTDDQNAIAETNALDMALYRVAAELCEEQMQKGGQAFQDRVKGFKDRKTKWLDELGDESLPEHLR
ncbi:hypothetical protein GC197_04585 [bacterium]|nr:hypothetical protein [bacterium]